jgi:hypothetical protein
MAHAPAEMRRLCRLDGIVRRTAPRRRPMARARSSGEADLACTEWSCDGPIHSTRTPTRTTTWVSLSAGSVTSTFIPHMRQETLKSVCCSEP